MAVIHLLLALGTGEGNLRGIDDHNEVASVDMRRVSGLALTAQNIGDLRRKSTESLALGVDHIPAAVAVICIC